jgi:class 3 adenylate cyclase
MLRVKALQDQVRSQAADLACWNRTLEQRVNEQLAEIERVGRLKHFLSHQIAELVLSSGGERLLESHRREITVVCCDLRGFTAFGEIAEPKDVMTVLREYHAALGRLIQEFEGTLEHFAGDSLLVLFNDPLPCPDPCSRAVTMAIEMRDRMAELASQWRTFGHDLGFGIGIAHGFATLGCIGFEGRLQYSATGSVANRACRLCSEAHNGQILIDSTVHSAVANCVRIVPAGELALKGFRRPVPAFSVCGLMRDQASDRRIQSQASAAPLGPRGRPCTSIGANEIEQSASTQNSFELPDFRLSTDSAASTTR